MCFGSFFRTLEVNSFRFFCPLRQSRKQHHVSFSSRFDLHSPKALHCCFRKQYGRVLCSHFVCRLRRRGADWLRSKTHKRLKERFLIRRNRTKRANFLCNHLFQATYNTTQNSSTNDYIKSSHVLSCSVLLKSILLISCVFWIFFQNAGNQLCFRFFFFHTVLGPAV